MGSADTDAHAVVGRDMKGLNSDQLGEAPEFFHPKLMQPGGLIRHSHCLEAPNSVPGDKAINSNLFLPRAID